MTEIVLIDPRISDSKRNEKEALSQDPLMDLLCGKPVEAPARKPEELPDADLISVEKVAKKLSLSVRSVQRLIWRGEIPHVSMSARCIRVPVKQLERWIERNTKGKVL